MTREERLAKIARNFYKNSVRDKAAKKRREYLKQELFRLMEYDFKGRSIILPVKTIEVPDAFWKTTGMTKDEFITSRFPGWEVEHCERNITKEITVFVLKQNPHYLPSFVEIEVDDQTVRVSKEVAEYTPEIDWETLQKERPDLFEKLAATKVVLVLDEEELEKLSIEAPEELATLERHMRVKEPALKVQPRMVKDDGKNV